MPPQNPADALDLTQYRPRTVKHAKEILGYPNALTVVVPKKKYLVAKLGSFERTVRVIRKEEGWTCENDGNRLDGNPCAHVLVILIKEDWHDAPRPAAVFRKTDLDRNHGLERRAWEAVPEEVPRLLARLLRAGQPYFCPDPEPDPTGGRPPTPFYALLFQAVMRVAFRQSLNQSRGWMRLPHILELVPDGGVSGPTLSRFYANPAMTRPLEKLLALSTWPAREHEYICHPDGTGLTEQHFGDYFDERYLRKKRKKPKVPEGVAVQLDAPTEVLAAVQEAALDAWTEAALAANDEPAGPRRHRWTYTEILWTYRYTLIAALHAADGPFGEAPWLIPLLKRASLVFKFSELGGDRAYVAHEIFQYAADHDMTPRIKLKKNANPPRGNKHVKAYKRAYEEWVRNPRGYAAQANRRNNAETGNHAFKAILGDQIFNKGQLINKETGERSFTARHNEILCMAIAYNLTRLVYLQLDQGEPAEFQVGAQVLAAKPWQSLQSIHDHYRIPPTRRPEWDDTAEDSAEP